MNCDQAGSLVLASRELPAGRAPIVSGDAWLSIAPAHAVRSTSTPFSMWISSVPSNETAVMVQSYRDSRTLPHHLQQADIAPCMAPVFDSTPYSNEPSLFIMMPRSPQASYWVGRT